MGLFWANGTAQAQTSDFGDYSLFPSASSTVNSTLRMGPTVEAESAATTNATATGDDITGSDDENGVTLPVNLVLGASGSLIVNVTNTRGSTAYLNVWIDWNNNGVLTDAGEQVAANTTISNGTSNSNRTVNFTAPVTATPGSLGVRVRLTSVSSPGPDGADGADGVGEVEDHILELGQGSDGQGGNETLPSGTYIIPMDNALQGNFNLKSYGLAVRLLHANVPLKWIINPAKGKDGVDFTANASRIKPSAIAAANLSFRGGPLAVHPGYESQALAVINAYGNNVAVYQLNAATSVNVDSTLVHKPKVAVFDQGGNGSIHVDVLQEAGLTMFTHYQMLNNATDIGAGSCFTVATEPHADDVGGATALLNFLLSGGNFFGQCAAIRDYTQQGLLAGYSTDGNLGGSMTYGNFQDPMAQFDGALADEGGSVTSFKLTSNPGFRIAYSSSDGTRYKAYVGRVAGAPIRGGWVHYLAGHNYDGSGISDINGRRMLLNAVLRPAGRPDNCSLVIPFDYGDWDGTALVGSYVDADRLRLGATVDAEVSVTPNASATADDNADSDDEDGVNMPASITQGATVTIPVSVFNNTGGTRYLHAWIDFNNDRAFNDALISAGGERLEAVRSLASSASASTVNITFVVPANASLGTQRGARFRISDSATTTPTSTPTQTGGVGEIEDYVVEILNGREYGDYSGFGSASSLVDSRLRLGALVDAESAAVTNATATGDDITGSDDEDGVTVPASLMLGAASTITVNVTNTTGSSAYLNAWIDFNRNGSLTDAGEQIATNTVISTGAANSSRAINFTVPVGASVGASAVRVRLTSTSSPGATSASGVGEVEDHAVTLADNMSIGNLVWNDANENGLLDNGESGINNVLVELWTTGADNAIGGTGGNADTRLATTTTAGGGLYQFNGLAAGRYYVKVPTPPLSRVSLVVDTADNGQDNDNNGAQPGGSGTSAYSPVIQLTAGQEPGSSGSGNVDNTIDFGFASNIGSPFACDNRFWVMQNAQTGAGGTWDSTLYYVGDDRDLVPVFIFSGYKLNGLASYGGYLYCLDQDGNHLYRINALGTLVDMGEVEGLPSPGGNGQWSGATSLTDGRMILNLYTWSPSTSTRLFTIDLSTAKLVGSGVTVVNTGTGNTYTGNFGDIVWDPLTGKVYGYSTSDSSWLGLFEINTTTGQATRVAAASPASWGSLIIDANGLTYGFGSVGASGGQNTLYVFNRTNGVLNGTMTAVGSGPAVSNSDGAACPGAPPSMKLGSLVWHDINNNGVRDAGESGIDGVSLRLFLGGQNPQTDAPVASVTTSGGGFYSFANLSPGQYLIHIPNPPAGYPLSSVTTVTLDNGVDNDDNGIQAGAGQPLQSPLIALAGGTESTTDGDTDTNSDMTLDFGFLACPAVTVNPATIASATVGSVYSQAFSASGGTGPCTWAVSAGALPAGLVLNASTGVISGTVASAATATFTLRASDAGGCTGTRSYTLTPVCPAISITPADAAAGTVGTAYTQTLTGSGGTAPYGSWSVISGALPAGLILNASTGVISGTPTVAAIPATSFTVRATDTYGCQGTQVISLKICPVITLSPTSMANGMVGITSSQTVTVTGGEPPHVFSIANGSLPAGLNLNTDTGVISGTPTSTASASFTLRATDTNGCSGTRAYSIAPLPNTDFGDFSSFGSASSTFNADLRLGASMDTEAAQTTNSAATGDDTTGTDDENGVTMPASITAGAEVTIPVVVTNTTGSTAYLNAWIDFNNNGSLADSGEQVAANVPIAAGSTNVTHNMEVTVPTAASVGSGRGARFRLTTTPSPGATGASGQGEVEDYIVTIAAPTQDFGDYSLFTSASSAANSKLRLGSSVDAEGSATTNAVATGDDITGSDDENGVIVPAAIIQGTNGSLTLNVTNTLGSTAYVNAWIDYNGNGVLTDAGEQIATNTTISNNTSNSNRTVNFTVPAVVKTGTVGVRVRITNVSSPGPDGQDGTGEVEDYITSITPNTDFGDYSLFSSASSRTNNRLKIGSLIDAEGGLDSDADATADDLDDSDDEDGVTLPDELPQGSSGSITVRTTNTRGSSAYLNAWIDFNRNGVLTDFGEQIASNTIITTGTSNTNRVLNFNVPGTASLGKAGVRVRLTSGSNPGPDGLDGIGEVEDHTTMIVLATTDFGDELDLADASSTASTSLRLGALVDVEGAPTKTADADGDDDTDSDDEDGLSFPSVTAGQPVALPVSVTNLSGAAGYLNAWIDYNNNGVLTDAGEQVATNVLVPSGTSNGTQVLNFNIPTNAVTAATSLATRFRITDIQNPGPTGHAGVGEVEDHPVVILAPLTDFGDFSGAPEVSNTASTNLRLGTLVDTEYASTRNATASGDDSTGVDDEDGVTLPSMIAGAPATITAAVTNSTGSSAYLNAWIDFNNNGVFTDQGEQVATNTAVANGTSNASRVINFTVPPAAVTGTNLGVRVRISNDISPGSTGAGGVGEVEDYVISIAAPTTDFGDFASFGLASSTVNAGLRLGALVDTEYAATTNVTASGDDSTAQDDEDGVVFPAMTAGAPTTIPVQVTNTSGANAYLNAWIDFNNNGSISDAGEQIAANVLIATGASNATQNLSFTIPAASLTGVNLGARFRLTSTTNPGVSGSSGNGEVEDHLVSILAPTTDFGDFSGFADASQGVNPALRLGALLDAEFSSTRNATATGDDTFGVDDEDGVALPTMIAGQTVDIPVTVTNETGANGFLSLWIDYNNNGVLTDAGERIVTNHVIATGATNSEFNFSITVPPTATTGVPLGVRARLSAPSGLGPTGNNSLAGEIEDYVVTIAAPTTDFGDHSGLSVASSTVNANLLLGTTVDAEFAATTNIAATGDDITGSDDENGVVMPASIDPGSTVVLPVTVRNNTGANAWLHAWIDFNNDGVLNNATIANGGERLEAARVIAPVNTGGILREYWTGISGTSVANLTSHANYPNNPNGSDLRSNFTAPTDWADNMGQRMRGWVYPPVSGEYTFWVSGDDETQLFLSTDATAASAALIARVSGWTSPLEWTKSSEQKSVKITLEAGKPYYIEALMKEGGGGDNLAAAWELPGTSTGPVVIAGQYLSPWSVNPPFNDTQQVSFTVPMTVNAGANRAVRFRLTHSATTTPTGASGSGEVEDYAVVITSATNDFGDWSGAANASNGVSDSLRLGALVDAEYFATTNATATGDDNTELDDEDGVTLPALTAGGAFTVPVSVTNLTGAAASLNAWIDFNNNGVFTDPGENVIVNLAVANGSNGLVINPSITVPVTAVTGTNVGVRFRLTSTASPAATGNGGGIGEVEDYVVNIAAPTTDFGDYSRFAAASSTVSNALRMGALVDAEYTAVTNLTATGDDTTGVADEDGVTLPSLMAGAPATIPVLVTNSTASSAYLNAWIDFNNNGVLTDPGEQVATNALVSTATTNSTLNLSFTVPPAAVTGAPLGVRVRLTSASTPGATGHSGTGEVEDYVTTISPPPLDFGDWSGLADAASTVTPGLRLGTLADTEFASTRNSTASGDDNTELDDEDGVTFTAMTAGAPASIAVNVTNTTAAPAYLNAWFDFNNNNSVADAGEQIATNILVAPGTSNATITLNLTIPANAVTGATLGTRFRLTNLASPGITGNVGLGEVEDHAATIAVPVTDFGDWSGAADASNIASSDLRMGALADTEYLPTKNAAATGDDTTGSDDEDGVTLPVLLPGTASSASVVVTNNIGAAGYLNAWIDFNNNGSFADAGEQIATNMLVAHGTNGVTQNIAFNTPINAIPGLRGSRFRLTAAQNPTSVGAGGLGEVEDHMVSVSCVPFAISPASLPAATVGTVWSQTLTTTGIHSPFVFNVTSGTLPAGLTLVSATGVISGTPTSSAAASFTITTTDANGCTGTRDYTLTPVCPAISITPASLAQGTVGTSFSRTLTATGGTLPHSSWTVITGALPAGLSLNASTGIISGTPTAAANPATSIVVRVNDANGCQATQSISLQICPVVTLSPVSLAASTVGAPYSQTISVSSGVSPHTFAVSSGSLPAGLSLNPSTGVISGTPTTAATATFTIRATDAHGCSGTRNYTLTPTCPELVLSPAALPTGYLGAAYTTTLSINGGTAPHTFSIQSGSLPNGVSLSSAGVFSGTPTAVGAHNLVLRATDFYGCTRTFDLTLQVRTLSLGNLIFEDANRNGLKDAGELGVAEALVQLFATGTDNAIGGSGAAADTQVGADVITGSTGDYLFADLPAGNYYVKVTPPVDYVEPGGTASVLDDNINDNNDGSQPGGPGTPLYSPVVNLTGGAESITDGDADADTNLSIDFGLWGSVAVGNFVFLDINGDGVRNEGESLGNIFVELYAEGDVPGVDEPVSVGSSGCSCKGRYFIENLNPGKYFLHIPAVQFTAGMALEGLLPMSVVVPGDDDVGQDLLFNSNPAINGASTAVFSLRPGLCPVGSAESGGEGTLDDEIDGRVDLTRDLGVVAPAGSGFAAGDRARRWLVTDETSGSVQTNANSFATWSQDNALGGPNDDADEDGLSNLLEYAFGTDPFSPLQPNRFSLTHDSAGIVANITQPLTTRDDLIVRLETLADLTQAADPAAWKTLNLASTTTFNGDDTLTRRYSGLERLLVFKGRDIGFIRLKVSLDADRNGVPEASTTTPVHAWSHQSFATGMRTFSMPLLKSAVFTGRVNSVLANEVMLSAIPTLPAASLYLEALDGALAGQRFEIDSALSSGNTLVLHEDGRAHHGLGGARVVIRSHHLLAEVLPPTAFTAGDRVLVFDTTSNNFTPLVQGGDAWSDGVLSMNMRPLAPHEAVLVDVRGESTARFITGEVPSADFILPLVPGAQLISTGWPASRSAPVTGLRSGSTPDNADRLRLWNGDTSSAITGYSGYYLDHSTTPPSWQPQDAETAPLPVLPPFHGFFLIREESLLLKSTAPW